MVSHWIASDLGWLISDAARTGCTSVLLDPEARLAPGLEACGEILRGGDEARIDAVFRELEAGLFVLSRPMVPFEYRDPLERLETRRRMMRRARAVRKKVDRMAAEGLGGHALRDAKQELAVLEDFESGARGAWRNYREATAG